MIALGLALILVGLVLAFEAGRSHGSSEAALRRGQLADQLEAATNPSRLRHPSSLGVDPRTVVDDEISEARS